MVLCRHTQCKLPTDFTNQYMLVSKSLYVNIIANRDKKYTRIVQFKGSGFHMQICMNFILLLKKLVNDMYPYAKLYY